MNIVLVSAAVLLLLLIGWCAPSVSICSRAPEPDDYVSLEIKS